MFILHNLWTNPTSADLNYPFKVTWWLGHETLSAFILLQTDSVVSPSCQPSGEVVFMFWCVWFGAQVLRLCGLTLRVCFHPSIPSDEEEKEQKLKSVKLKHVHAAAETQSDSFTFLRLFSVCVFSCRPSATSSSAETQSSIKFCFQT